MDEKHQSVTDTLETATLDAELVVHNDNINTFDHVISTLIRVCKHTNEQAQQCTLLIHFKGKCTVKTGPIEKLKPQCLALLEAGLSATIS